MKYLPFCVEFLEFIKTKPVVDFLTVNKDQPEVRKFLNTLDKFKAEKAEYMKRSFAERVKSRAIGPVPPKITGRSMQSLKPPKGQPSTRKKYSAPRIPAQVTPTARPTAASSAPCIMALSLARQARPRLASGAGRPRELVRREKGKGHPARLRAMTVMTTKQKEPK